MDITWTSAKSTQLLFKPIMAFFCVFVLVLGFENTAHAEVDVRDVRVDVTADSGLKARDLGITTAKRKAFEKLIQSNEFFASKFEGQSQPSDKDLDEITETFEVHSEKISAKRYIGTFTISFSKSGLDRIMSGHFSRHQMSDSSKDAPNNNDDGNSSGRIGDNAQDEQDNIASATDSLADSNRDVVLVPVYVTPDESFLWTKNPWREFWQHSPQDDVLTVKIPLGDLRDILSVSVEDLMTNRAEKVDSLLKRYNKSTVLFVSLKRYAMEGGEAELLVKIFKEGDVLFVSEPIPLSAPDDLSLFELARIETIKTIQNYESSVANLKSNVMQTFSITAQFSSFMQWQNIRRNLNIPQIKSFHVSNLTTRSARITVKTNVSSSQLRSLLQGRGLSFSEGMPGQYSLSVSGGSPQQSGPFTSPTQPDSVLR